MATISFLAYSAICSLLIVILTYISTIINAAIDLFSYCLLYVMPIYQNALND